MSTADLSKSATNQLWGIYYADREYACEMGAPLRTVVEAPTKLAAEETAARLGFSEPWAHPVTEEQAKQAQTATEPSPEARTGPRLPHLMIRTPSTAELRIAIQVLERLGERLTAHANHSIKEMPKTQLGNHYAGQIESKAIEQTTRINLVTTELKNWRDELLQQRQTVSHHV
jgi:hypothetical protein